MSPGKGTLELECARNERLSFQACVKYSGKGQIKVGVKANASKEIDIRIRRVGFVPIPHHNTGVPEDEMDCRGHIPGYVPDPLFDESEAVLLSGENAGFWFTVNVSGDCRPGRKSIIVAVYGESRKIREMKVSLTVHPLLIKARKNFPVVQWFYNDAIIDWYKCAPFDARYWKTIKPYMENLPEHGQDTIYVPIFTPPLDGVKRPTQLLGVQAKGSGKYRFDWKDVRRYVNFAKMCGIKHFEWTHFFTQWGAANAIRVYERQGIEEKLLWKPQTAATSPTYKMFLKQLMPQFKHFLDAEKILERSFFHVSDEPHGLEHRESYKKARGMLKEVAPWMKTMDALSDIEFGRQKLTDMPVPSIAVTKQFAEEGIPSFTYFCCGPRGRYLNRLIDTPLIKIRMSGWLFYKFKRLGFLHWGYNYWYKSQTRQLIDPYAETGGQNWPSWPHGDPFVVYPGENGPVDSIRWEIFAESLQDYAMLQSLNIDPDSGLLGVFEDFDRFPKSVTWLKIARNKMLSKC